MDYGENAYAVSDCGASRSLGDGRTLSRCRVLGYAWRLNYHRWDTLGPAKQDDLMPELRPGFCTRRFWSVTDSNAGASPADMLDTRGAGAAVLTADEPSKAKPSELCPGLRMPLALLRERREISISKRRLECRATVKLGPLLIYLVPRLQPAPHRHLVYSVPV